MIKVDSVPLLYSRAVLNPYVYILYRKKGKFGESSIIRQLKPSKLVITINNLLADLLIRQTIFRHILENSPFAKLPRYTVASNNRLYIYTV